jgi:hypothetical protein
MATNTAIKLKKSGITGNTPADLLLGEVAINYADGKLYYKNDLNSVQYITNQKTFGSVLANGSLIVASTPTDILGITANSNIRIITDTVGKSFSIDLANTISVSGNVYSNNTIIYNQLYAGIATYSATPLPNLIAQFTGNSSLYVQVNAQNIDRNGSSDYVATADVGADDIFFIDLGIQNSNAVNGTLKPLDGYLYVQGNTGQLGGNLIIGTTSQTPGQQIRFVAGGLEDSNVIVVMDTSNTTIKNNLITQGTISGPTIANLQAQINSIQSNTGGGGGNSFGIIYSTDSPAILANTSNSSLRFIAQTGIAIGLDSSNSSISIATNTFGASNLVVDFGTVTDILGAVTFDYGYVA